MQLFILASLTVAFLANFIIATPVYEGFSHHDVSINKVESVKRDLTKRAPDLYCDNKAPWLGTTNCAYIWTGIYHLQDKVKDQALICPPDTRCRWSCSYNSALYWENTSPQQQSITGRQFADEIISIIKECRPSGTCMEENAGEYWFQAEKNWGRDTHKIMISHTTPFNENC